MKPYGSYDSMDGNGIKPYSSMMYGIACCVGSGCFRLYSPCKSILCFINAFLSSHPQNHISTLVENKYNSCKIFTKNTNLEIFLQEILFLSDSCKKCIFCQNLPRFVFFSTRVNSLNLTSPLLVHNFRTMFLKQQPPCAPCFETTPPPLRAHTKLHFILEEKYFTDKNGRFREDKKHGPNFPFSLFKMITILRIRRRFLFSDTFRSKRNRFSIFSQRAAEKVTRPNDKKASKKRFFFIC